jgi:hypothetical protein
MLKSEAAEIASFLQYLAEWEVSPNLKAEIEQAIEFYKKRFLQ